MTEKELNTWIFLSIATQTEPTTWKGISSVADGINHAVPTHKELQTSLSWLMKNDFIQKLNRKYSLSDVGRITFDSLKDSTTYFAMWKELQKKM